MMSQEVQMFLYLLLGLVLFGGFIILFVFVSVDIMRAVFSDRKERWIVWCIESFDWWWNNFKSDTKIALHWTMTHCIDTANIHLNRLTHIMIDMEHKNEVNRRKAA